MIETETKDDQPKDCGEWSAIVGGFQEMWNPVFQRFQVFFKAANNLNALQNRVLGVPALGQASEIIRYILKTMSNDYGAVLSLVLNGYGVQAMKIARSMFEAECNVLHLKTAPQGVQDYIDFEPITRKKLYDLMTPDRQKALDPAWIENMHMDYAAAAPRFLRNKKGELRDSWCEVSLFKRAQAAGLEDLYHVAYGIASSMHHYDFQAIVSSLDGDSEEIAVAPSWHWLGEALSTAHGALVRSLRHYLDVTNIGFENEIRAAEEECDAVNKALVAIRDLKTDGG